MAILIVSKPGSRNATTTRSSTSSLWRMIQAVVVWTISITSCQADLTTSIHKKKTPTNCITRENTAIIPAGYSPPTRAHNDDNNQTKNGSPPPLTKQEWIKRLEAHEAQGKNIRQDESTTASPAISYPWPRFFRPMKYNVCLTM